MRLVPVPFSLAWMDTLADNELLDAEVRLRAHFGLLEQRELKLRGHTHPLMRGPDDLMETWDRWNRLLFAAHERSLRPRPASPKIGVMEPPGVTPHYEVAMPGLDRELGAVSR